MKITALRYGTTFLGKDQIFKCGEKNDLVRISLLYFLVETENKKILIDVGCDEMNGFNLIEHKRPVEVLEEYGVKREQITDIILTHTHGDHSDCVFYYPNATVFVNENEKSIVERKIAHTQKIVAFNSSLSLVERIYVRHVGGHSSGSCVVEIACKDKTLVFVGDECYHKSCFDNPKGTKSMFCEEKTQWFLSEYKKEKYKTFVFHDEDIVKHLGAEILLSD